MQALYDWERALVKERYFDPLHEGYHIDDLMRNDRQIVAGMLYTLREVIEAWRDEEERQNRTKGGVMGMLADEYIKPAADRFEERFMKVIRLFVEDAIDCYALEKEKDTASAGTDTVPST